MHSLRIRRAAVSSGVLLLLIGGLLAGPVLAKPPAFAGSATAVPGTVSPGGTVRYNVSFTNTSPSNLSQLFLNAATPNGASLEAIVAGPSQGTCDDGGVNLSCTFGALNAGASVTFSVVYTTTGSGSSMTVPFVFSSTGSTGSDKGKNSHGDDFIVAGRVTLNGSDDFSGMYLFDPDELTVADNQNVGRQNPQSTKATSNQAGVPLTVGEVGAGSFDCPGISTASCFGQWSVVNLNDGAIVAGGFEVVIGYDKVPGNADTVRFVHLVGSGSTFITQMCGGTITVNCIASIDQVASDVFYTLIVDNNGPMRGF